MTRGHRVWFARHHRWLNTWIVVGTALAALTSDRLLAQQIASVRDASISSLRQGTKLRIITDDSTYYYGRYHSVRHDTLLIAEWWREHHASEVRWDTLRVALRNLRFLDYSLGSGASRGLILGAAVGVGTGLVLGFVAGGGGEPSRGQLAVGGAVVLLPVGMLVGAIIGTGTSEWHPLHFP